MKADCIFLYKYLLPLSEIKLTPHSITCPYTLSPLTYAHIYVYTYSCIPGLTFIEMLSHAIFTHPQGFFQLMEYSSILRLR